MNLLGERVGRQCSGRLVRLSGERELRRSYWRDGDESCVSHDGRGELACILYPAAGLG